MASSFKYTVGVELTLKINWSWNIFDISITRVGYKLFGSIIVGFKAFYKSDGCTNTDSVGIEQDLVEYCKDLKKIYIPILGVPIPGMISGKIKLSYVVAISKKVKLSTSYNTGVEFSAKTVMDQSGVSKEAPQVTPSSSKPPLKETVNGVDANYTVTPAITLRWPDVSVPWHSFKAFRRSINLIKAKKDHCRKGSDVNLEFSVGFPITLSFSKKTCTCEDPVKHARLRETLGLDSVDVGLNAYIWTVLAHKFTQARWTWWNVTHCFAVPEPCCQCKDTKEPGRIDKKTGECMCKCFCDPLNNKTASMKTTDGDCQCDMCPDGSLKKVSANITCPCKCADGVEKEMEKDGSCKCNCTCGDGVTNGTITADGSCSCNCTCKNCENSTLGPDGCKCPNDVCPRCKSGEEATWQGCECKCPEVCGHPPMCGKGRRGQKCDEPDCTPCQSCKRHGVCTKGPACTAFCLCEPRWQGKYCKDPVPRRAFGDPHLETLDGIEFNYFGIGQFWDCKSEENDFGCQVRYFHYKHTSLIGAIALKAGQSIITITTPAIAQPGDVPTVRIDGNVQETDTSQRITLGNDTVLLDILSQNATSGGNDATSGTMISLQFQSGTSVTVATSYSAKMKRLFLSVTFAPTGAFFKKTAGLCGFMDSDDTNDLTGPDGILYNNTDAFAESWRIAIPHRTNGGKFGSWSWTESNFHPDDVMDLSYTDPTYKPVYTLEGYTASIIDAATTLCKKQGLTGTLLKGCIYDVVVSNDTALAEQETLKIGCPNQCSGKGHCVNNTCKCLTGWSTEDCHLGSCGSCYHGNCAAGFCRCHFGWDGVDCSHKATCEKVNDCTDSSHGRCRSQDVCLCQDGFTGIDCSVTATCYNQHNCSFHGVCVDFDICRCDVGWTASSCSQPSCEILNWCSGHGQCIGHDVCLCESSWTDNSCSTPDCSHQNDCSNHGDCLQPGTCSCHPGYEGADCNANVKCRDLDNCNDHGLCITTTVWKDNNKQSLVRCRCDPGFDGNTCNSPVCEPSCSSHGSCFEPNVCSCDTGYTGPTCAQPSCETMNRCSGHGQCTGLEHCTCDDGWFSENCGTANCANVDDCSSHGQCISPDSCSCFDGFEGRNCGRPVGADLNAPIFDKSNYHCTVSEKAKSGTSLVDVHATDADQGKNGDIHYELVPYAAQIDTTPYLVVNSQSGRVTLLSPIPHNLLSSDTLLVWVKAVDGGVPPREAKAQLHIRVLDGNDHCPKFLSPDSGSIHFVNMSTEIGTTVIIIEVADKDIGDNGEVTLSFGVSTDSVVYDTFDIDSPSGRISSLVSPLTIGRFQIDIVATDGAATPCSKQLSVILQVLPPDIKPPTNSTIAPRAPPNTTLTMESMTTQTSTEGGHEPVATTTPTSRQTTPQQREVDSSSSDSSSSFIVIGSVFAIVVLVGVLVIAVLKSKVGNLKAQIKEEKPRNTQRRWHTHFNDYFHPQRE